jgi:hypothetical protein
MAPVPGCAGRLRDSATRMKKDSTQRPNWRPFLAHLCAIVVLGAGLYAAAVRAKLDHAFIYSDAVRSVYPAGHLRQVEIFKSTVPKGSVFYIMDQPEFWQAGLWRRSLYPDNPVIQVYDPTLVHTSNMENLRDKLLISYALCAGNPPPDPGFEWKIELPSFPGSVPIVLGKLKR